MMKFCHQEYTDTLKRKKHTHTGGKSLKIES